MRNEHLERMHEFDARQAIAMTDHALYNAIKTYGENTPLGYIERPYMSSTHKLYFSKEDYLEATCHPRGLYQIQYLSDAKGWNPEWGDIKIETARARRKYQAEYYFTQRKQILETPLSKFFLPYQRYEYIIRDSKGFVVSRRVTGDVAEYQRWIQESEKIKEENVMTCLKTLGYSFLALFAALMLYALVTA